MSINEVLKEKSCSNQTILEKVEGDLGYRRAHPGKKQKRKIRKRPQSNERKRRREI